MLKILKYLTKKDWMFVLCSFLFVVVQVYLDLRLPDYMSEITRLVQTPNSEMSEILSAGGYMLLCAFGSLIAAFIVGYFAAQIASNLSWKLRSSVYDKIEGFSMAEINKFSTASLITRSTNDITQIQNIVAMGLQLIIKAPITAVWAVCKILDKGWQWSGATGGAILVLVLIILVIMIFALPRFKKIQKLTDRLNLVTRENLTGIRVVRAYNAENYQKSKFENVNEEITKNNLVINRVMSIMQPGMMFVMNGLTLAIYWIGAYLINDANIMDKMNLFSDMIVFTSYSMQVIMAFMMLTMIFIMMPRASVSAKRILEVLNTKESIVDGDGKFEKTSKTGEIEFKNVSFKYPDSEGSDYVLRDISFTAKMGETVAIIGSTGSGKTSLINLIPRFYDVTEGEVLVNGVNVKKYKQKELNNLLGYVHQKAVLFSGDITSNVAYGNNGKENYSELDVKRAVKIAQGTEFVEKMENTYNASISQGGSNVSGGQKQRLSIARAICRKPEIYIFDDSFSALDYKTDRKLRSVLKHEISNATNLIVAQRIGTIIDADKIIVLDEGQIAGMGTHHELMTKCRVYQEIAYSQLSKEELANA
ncbi:MAG: ABC transporter ATP-binding protein [Terrisporobacter othiniensis]|uniref:ABC transporter ATP-binding protein n=1 Tax=Terrisporobacter petrolearius TaxID=1460447 RepID=UPI0022E15DF7|nr:ABC transporter ATP-binding protein [Terrisporobacter petrolearius]MDU4860958.1 ABC transporter ATP-binding protein [Terrisporobacter othiniensis]MDU6993536.1 ABC transporter ATP-binding protein [Terrisporobacter othiniensis]